MFEIHLGVPEMEAFWSELTQKVQDGSGKKKDLQLYKKIGKAMKLLFMDPSHPGLHSHEIASLTARYGTRVWQSYLENNTPAAGRLYWAYGPGQGQITIIGIEPHPNDSKQNAYRKVTLSSMGEELK